MSKHQPALLGGLFIGVMSTLPVVSSFNACCCLWVLCGGALVVYLQQQRTAEPVETGDAVIGALIAGVVGAVIAGLGTMLLFSAGGDMVQDQVRMALDNPDVPPEVRDMVMRFTEGQNIALFGFLINLPLFSVFSIIGALIGLAIFRKKPPTA
jgi:hypothetical protein